MDSKIGELVDERDHLEVQLEAAREAQSQQYSIQIAEQKAEHDVVIGQYEEKIT